MGTPIKGKNLRIRIDDKLVYHATEAGLSISVNMESISTKDTQGEINTPSNYTWSLSISALVAEIASSETALLATHNPFNALTAKTLAMEEVDVEFTTDETGDTIWSGKAYFTQADFTAPNEGYATGSFSLQGNGNLTQAVVS